MKTETDERGNPNAYGGKLGSGSAAPVPEGHPAPARRGVDRLQAALRRQRPSRRAVSNVAAGIAAFAAVAALLTWPARAGEAELQLDLTVSAEACCHLAVWLNALDDGPEATLPLQAGRQQRYLVPVHEESVASIRIDIGESPDAEAVVHDIRIVRGSDEVDRVSRAELTGFGASRAALEEVPDGLRVRAEAAFPAISGDVSLESGTRALPRFLAKVARQPLDYLVGLLLLGTLGIAAAVHASTRLLLPLVALLVAFGLLFAVAAGTGALAGVAARADISESVGYSAYIGDWKAREQLLLWFTVVGTVALPLLLAGAERLRARAGAGRADGVEVSARTDAEPLAAAPEEQPPWRVQLPLVGGIVLLLALYFAPDLRQELVRAQTELYGPGWDANNLLFWDYLVQQGRAPVRDFLYPYGFQYLFTIDAPWGPLLGYANYMAFWAYLVAGTFFALARLVCGRALVHRFAIVMALVLLAVLAGYLPLGIRYVGALGVVLLFFGIGAREPVLSGRRVLFAVALVHLTLFEPAQAVYALVPIAFLLAVEFVPVVRRAPRAAAAGLVVPGATLAIPALVVAAVLAVTGRIGATVDFYLQLGALQTAWGAPAPVREWFSRPDDLAGFVFWSVPVALALGLAGVLLARRAGARRGPALVAALGLLGLMMMQKQVMRPGIAPSIWLPAVYGLLLWTLTAASFPRLRHQLALAGTLGAIVALVLVAGRLEPGLERAASAPSRVAGSVASLANDRDEFAEAARARFSRDRFVLFGPQLEVARALEEDEAVRSGGRVWILGDDSPVIMLLGQDWPYYFNSFYDTSPVAWQRKLLGRLESHPPARVAWNRDPMSLWFDGVPHVVRVPLIFEWAVRNLVPERSVGSFEILRPRERAESIALEWWRERLGPTVELGHVPLLTDIGDEVCAAGDECATYLVAEYADAGSLPPFLHIPLTVDGLEFGVTFATQPGVSRYAIRLDRLWFWSAPADRASRAIAVEPGAGSSLRIVERRRAADVLY